MRSIDRNLKHLWSIDNCDSSRLKNSRDHFVEFRKFYKVDLVNAASIGVSEKVVETGNVKVRQIIDGVQLNILLNEVGYASDCQTNLVSAAKAERFEIKINFHQI